MCSRLRLPGGHLGHSPHASAPQPRVLVAVPPAVDCALNETTLPSQARIQLCQCPANGIALRFVVQPVAFVLVFRTARTRVHAVLRLEVLGKLIDVDRLYITPNRVLHLHSVARVLKSNPLHAVLVLPYDKRGSGRNRSRRSIWVHVWPSWRACVHVWRTDWRTLRRSLRRTKP